MMLEVFVDNEVHEVEIPEAVLAEGESFFARIDADLEKGWSVGARFIEQPDTETRAKIVADRLLGAIESGNTRMAPLLAGYLVSRLPGLTAVRIDPNGEPLMTEFWRGR